MNINFLYITLSNIETKTYINTYFTLGHDSCNKCRVEPTLDIILERHTQNQSIIYLSKRSWYGQRTFDPIPICVNIVIQRQ